MENNNNVITSAPCGEGRLTRAAFTRTLQTSQGQTIFDIRGLSRLKHTFATLDEATPDRTLSHSSSTTTTTNSQSNGTTATTTCAYDACKALLEDAAGTDYEKGMLPDAPEKEYSDLLSQPKEFFGPDFRPPCSKEQITMLIRDRNQFTAAEDSLVFRGVVRARMCGYAVIESPVFFLFRYPALFTCALTRVAVHMAESIWRETMASDC